MSRMVGTVSRGIRTPIIRSGDDLVEIVTSSLLEAAKEDGFALRDRDIVAMTEAIVARAQGNYASVDDIAADVRTKLGGGTVGGVRFGPCGRGVSSCRKREGEPKRFGSPSLCMYECETCAAARS